MIQTFVMGKGITLIVIIQHLLATIYFIIYRIKRIARSATLTTPISAVISVFVDNSARLIQLTRATPIVNTFLLSRNLHQNCLSCLASKSLSLHLPNLSLAKELQRRKRYRRCMWRCLLCNVLNRLLRWMCKLQTSDMRLIMNFGEIFVKDKIVLLDFHPRYVGIDSAASCMFLSSPFRSHATRNWRSHKT